MTLNHHPFRVPIFLVSLVLNALVWASCPAQLPPVSDSRLGLDMIRLRGGQRLYGFVLERGEDRSSKVAIERNWLRKTHPQVYGQQLASEEQQLRLAREELESRISVWIEERQKPIDQVLVRFLESELDRIHGDSIGNQAGRLFTVLNIPPNELREIKLQSPENRQLAGLAYQFGLDAVVTTPAQLLEKRLKEQGINPVSEVVDLSSQVPAWQIHSSRQWAAKQALVEYQLREELQYQGTVNKLIRKAANDVDIGALVGSMFAISNLDAIGQLGAELGLPEFSQFSSTKESRWWKQVVREAEADGFAGVLITRLEQSLLSPDVKVAAYFFARDQPGSWFLVFMADASENVNAQSADRVRRIKEDPQVKQVLDILTGLGLAVEDRLDHALRHGAATERAMSRAVGAFNLFLAKNIRVLDGMPVFLHASDTSGDVP